MTRARQQTLSADFEAYLEGFSPNVQEILEKFKFRNQIPTLIEADVLGSLIEKFLDSSINLSPRPVLNANGEVVLPGLDNHGMGTIFEELIRRFNEENNERPKCYKECNWLQRCSRLPTPRNAVLIETAAAGCLSRFAQVSYSSRPQRVVFGELIGRTMQLSSHFS